MRYPRGAQAEKQHHEAAMAALMRARTPEAPSLSSCGCSWPSDSRAPPGLANADRQGIYEP